MLHHAMAKKNDEQYVPSRRRERGKKLNAPIWVYLDGPERELCEWAALTSRRSVSSWAADVLMERAHEMARLHNLVTAPPKPSTREVLDSLKPKPKKPR